MQVTYSPEFETEFKKLNTGKLKWLIVRHANPTGEASPIIVDSSGPKGSTHADMFAKLTPEQPRIVLYNLQLSVSNEGGSVRKDKLIIMSWIPNGLVGNTGVKAKMLASASTGHIKNFYQIAHLVQASTLDEATLEAIAEKACRFERDPIVEGSIA